MTKVIITFFTFFLLINSTSFSQKKKTTYYDPYTRTKIKDVYYVNSAGKENGLFVRYSPNQEGVVILKMNLVNGNVNGKKEEYYSLQFQDECTKLPHTISNYSYGIPHGEWYEYTCNNKSKRVLTKHVTYDKNKVDEDGIHRPIFIEEYTEFGEKKSYGSNYNGLYTEYNPATGKPLKQHTYKNFKIIKSTYYWSDDNGNIQSENWTDENGKEITKHYDREGRLEKIEKMIDNFEYEISEYYESGNLKKKYNQKNSKYFGEYKSFYENGSLKELAEYIDFGHKKTYFVFNNEGDTLGFSHYDGNRRIGHNKIITDLDNPKALIYDIYFDDNGNFDSNKPVTISNLTKNIIFKGYLSYFNGFIDNIENYDKPSISFYDNGSVKSYSFHKKFYKFYENGILQEIIELNQDSPYNYNYTFNEEGIGQAKYDYKYNSYEKVWKRGNKYPFPKKANFLKNAPVSFDDLCKEYELDKSYRTSKNTLLGEFNNVRDKKELYKKYEILLQYYRKNNEIIKINNLHQKMEILINQETSDLEKSLKKQKTIEEIEMILLN